MAIEQAKAYIGIDIGLMGAIVVHIPGSVISVFDMPIKKLPVLDKKGRPVKKKKETIYDIPKIIDIFRNLVSENCTVFIEKAQILPKGFTIKGNIGVARCQALFEGILSTLGLKYEIINPRIWQLYFGIETEKDDKGTVIKNTKEQSVEKCKTMFPGIILETEKGRKLDGRADAALICYYGMRTHEGEIGGI